MFKKIGDFFKKLWKAIKKIIVALLLVIAIVLIIWSVIATGGATLAIFGFAISTTMAMVIGVLCVVGAFLVDKDYAGELVGKVGDAVGNAAQAVGEVVGDVASSTLSGFLSSPVGIGLLGVGAYFLLTTSSNKSIDSIDEDDIDWVEDPVDDSLLIESDASPEWDDLGEDSPSIMV
jgi:uncharacterized membrane protein